MRSFKPYFLKLSALLLVVVFLQSCTEKSGWWKNEKIKSGKRDDFHLLNNQVFKLLKTNNFKELGYFMSKELLEDNYTERHVELVSNRLTDADYSLADEYYAINKYRDDDTIQAVGAGKNKYDLYYPGTTREVYMAFFLPKAGENKYMITVVYRKYDYGWKIGELTVEPYTINGKTAPELFDMAKAQYAKNYLMDAVNTMTLAGTCRNPNKMWKYLSDEEMSSFYAKVATEVDKKYKFPMTLTAVATKPRILRVYTETTAEGSYPMIYYLSAIKLKDTMAIKKENANVKQLIGKVIPGIDKDKKYVYYSVFNVKPGGGKTVDHYDVTDKLK